MKKIIIGAFITVLAVAINISLSAEKNTGSNNPSKKHANISGANAAKFKPQKTTSAGTPNCRVVECCNDAGPHTCYEYKQGSCSPSFCKREGK